jgi:hypothetical protein
MPGMLSLVPGIIPPKKKADMLEQTQRFEHVGLLVNWLPGKSERPFI